MMRTQQSRRAVLRSGRFVRSALVVSALAVFTGGVACGQAAPTKFDSDTTGTPGEGPLGPSGSTDGGEVQGECSAATTLVYVVTEDGRLYSFAPDKLEFALIGTMDCPSESPFSMAVDRSGTAWVLSTRGTLVKVSTKDARCTSTNFAPGQRGFGLFGMGFAANGPSAREETLYAFVIHEAAHSTEGPVGLATIDLSTLTLEPVASLTGNLRGKGAELTGTGDGRLFGFFTSYPSTLAEIDKVAVTTPKESRLEELTTGLGTSYAFAFWGGDFWFFRSGGDVPSSVSRLATSGAGDLRVVIPDVGDVGTIVGAGVSTCAPVIPPH